MEAIKWTKRKRKPPPICPVLEKKHINAVMEPITTLLFEVQEKKETHTLKLRNSCHSSDGSHCDD